MTPSGAGQRTASQDLEYLTVDDFIRTLVDARALKTAFELGLIDHLLERRASAVAALPRKSLSSRATTERSWISRGSSEPSAIPPH